MTFLSHFAAVAAADLVDSAPAVAVSEAVVLVQAAKGIAVLLLAVAVVLFAAAAAAVAGID
jgi:hypothetical protein